VCLKLISFIFLIIFLFAYPFVWSQSQSDSFYLPLAIGNQWIYESENNYFADTLTVVDTQSVDGKLYYAIQQDSYDLYLWFREENNKVYIVDTVTIEPFLLKAEEYLIYNFSSDTDDSREVPLTNPNLVCSYAGEVTLESKNDTINTIMGDFYNCYRFSRKVLCMDAGIFEEWFTPGIGRVAYYEMSFFGINRYYLVYTNVNTDVADKSNLNTLNDYKLWQNYPNPFNPTTKIMYSITAVRTSFAKSIQLKVFDILGNEIATLVNEEKSPSNYEVEFDGSNLPSGVYFYRLQAGNFIDIKKFILLK
jgi:hypothetical protein